MGLEEVFVEVKFFLLHNAKEVLAVGKMTAREEEASVCSLYAQMHVPAEADCFLQPFINLLLGQDYHQPISVQPALSH